MGLNQAFWGHSIFYLVYIEHIYIHLCDLSCRVANSTGLERSGLTESRLKLMQMSQILLPLWTVGDTVNHLALLASSIQCLLPPSVNGSGNIVVARKHVGNTCNFLSFQMSVTDVRLVFDGGRCPGSICSCGLELLCDRDPTRTAREATQSSQMLSNPPTSRLSSLQFLLDVQASSFRRSSILSIFSINI